MVECFGGYLLKTARLITTFVVLTRNGKRTCRKFEPIRKWMDQRGKGALEEI